MLQNNLNNQPCIARHTFVDLSFNELLCHYSIAISSDDEMKILMVLMINRTNFVSQILVKFQDIEMQIQNKNGIKYMLM